MRIKLINMAENSTMFMKLMYKNKQYIDISKIAHWIALGTRYTTGLIDLDLCEEKLIASNTKEKRPHKRICTQHR